MNIIDKMFFNKKKNILSIYFTAGYPTLESTIYILRILQKYNVDVVEVGIPYSEPLADGSIIQYSSNKSLINGMNINKLFTQLQCIKKELYIPVIFMGYYNTFLQFGEEFFLKKCRDVGISGVIFPDIPTSLYQEKYKYLLIKYEIYFIFLVTIHTPIERILYIKSLNKGFLYLISSTSTTGRQFFWSKKKDEFFTFLDSKLKLHMPKLMGFGIDNKNTFNWACSHANGAIIGSAFIRALNVCNIEKSIQCFLQKIKK